MLRQNQTRAAVLRRCLYTTVVLWFFLVAGLMVSLKRRVPVTVRVLLAVYV